MFVLGRDLRRVIEASTNTPIFGAGAASVVGTLSLGATGLLWLISLLWMIAVAGLKAATTHKPQAEWVGNIGPLVGVVAGLLFVPWLLMVLCGIALANDLQYLVSAGLWSLVTLTFGFLAQKMVRSPVTPLATGASIFTVSLMQVFGPEPSWVMLLRMAGVPIGLAGALLAASGSIMNRRAKELAVAQAIRLAAEAQRAEVTRQEVSQREALRQAAEAARQAAAEAKAKAEATAKYQAAQERIAYFTQDCDAEYSWYLGDNAMTTYYVGDWTFEHVRDGDSKGFGYSYITAENDNVYVEHCRRNGNNYAYTDDEGRRHVTMTTNVMPGGDKVWPLYRQYIAAYRRCYGYD